MESIKTLILCGGRGIRLFDNSNYIPKALVNLGHKPIIWHVMKRYALFGHTNFILALGMKGDLIRNYFLQYKMYTNDLYFELGNRDVQTLTHSQEENWKITLTDTGDQAMTGARISRCQQYIKEKEFMVTYADNVADIDLADLLAFHRKSKKIATVTGVNPPYREIEFEVKDNMATGFFDVKTKKPGSSGRYINGGYMVFNKEIFDYLSPFNECRLETEVFAKLIQEKQLAVYPHHGFWRWMDTDRDYLYLNSLVDKNQTYWLQQKNQASQ